MAVLSHEGTYPILYGTSPIPIGAGHRDGYIARPDEFGQFPVVFVVPGIDGMGSLEKDICRRFARFGIAAISLDLYRNVGDGLASYNALTDDRALTDIDELHEFIISDDVVWNISGDVGLVGTEIGGRFAIIKAATRDWVKSIAVCYTPLTGDEDREHQVADYLDHLPVPVLGLYGTNDELVDTASVDEAQRRNHHGQWLLYDGAQHGFLDIDSVGFDQAASDDAFARMTAFFEATLAKAVIENLG